MGAFCELLLYDSDGVDVQKRIEPGKQHVGLHCPCGACHSDPQMLVGTTCLLSHWKTSRMRMELALIRTLLYCTHAPHIHESEADLEEKANLCSGFANSQQGVPTQADCRSATGQFVLAALLPRGMKIVGPIARMLHRMMAWLS